MCKRWGYKGSAAPQVPVVVYGKQTVEHRSTYNRMMDTWTWCVVLVVATGSCCHGFTFPNVSETQYMDYLPAARQPDNSNIRFQNDDSPSDAAVNGTWGSHIDRLISHGVMRLAFQLDHVMGPSGKSLLDERNIVFSPTSIASALALVLLGSSSKTRQEVANVLGLSAGIGAGAGNSDVLHQHFGHLLDMLQVSPSQSLDTYTASASAVFVQQNFPIKEHFKSIAQDTYNSEIVNVDFATGGQEAMETVNNWIFNNTYGLIENILDQVPSPQTLVIIASALYFNGAWKYTFPLQMTSWRPFHVGTGSNDEVLQVIMMKTAGEEMLYHEDKKLGCRVVGLPYKGDAVTMFLVLPDDPGVLALRQFQSQLTPQYLQDLADSATKASVIISLPRMHLESTIQLKDTLKSLGVHSLFDPYTADLSELADSALSITSDILERISENKDNSSTGSSENQNEDADQEDDTMINGSDYNTTESNSTVEYNNDTAPIQSRILSAEIKQRQRNKSPLYANNVIHKVVIDVTETGTVASATTVVSLTRDGSHKIVQFNRPFLFFIRHEPTKLPLFWGSVVRPVPYQNVR